MLINEIVRDHLTEGHLNKFEINFWGCELTEPSHITTCDILKW